MRNLFLVLIINSFSFLSFGQSTYTITNSTGQGAGTIYDAFNFANTEMALGNDVTILFNAPGLCLIETDYLPLLSSSSAVKLTLIKHSSSTVSQGVELSPLDFGNPTIINSIQFVGNNLSDFTTFDLTFKNLSRVNSGYAFKIGCKITEVASVDVRNCHFIDSRGHFASDSTIFTNNLIEEPTPISPTSIGIYDFIESQVTNNSFRPNSYLTVFNKKQNSNSIISDNAFDTTRIGLTLVNPVKSWTVNSNLFNQSALHLYRWNSIGSNVINSGLELIGNNSLGYQLKNDLNVFNGAPFSGNSIDVSVLPNSSNIFFEDGIFIIGQNLLGRVAPSGGQYSIIRANSITNFPLPNKRPIDLIYSTSDFGSNYGNLNIPKPIISATASSSSNLSFSYSFPPVKDPYFLDAANESFVIDVYTSNANFDLVNYIGNIIVPAQSYNGNTENVTIPLNGNSVSPGDKIAFTVTSLGDVNQLPLGTSEVTYSTVAIAPPCNVSIDLPTEFCAGTDLVFTANSDVTIDSYYWTLNNNPLSDTSASITQNFTLEPQQNNIGVNVYGINGEFCQADVSFTIIDCDTLDSLCQAAYDQYLQCYTTYSEFSKPKFSGADFYLFIPQLSYGKFSSYCNCVDEYCFRTEEVINGNVTFTNSIEYSNYFDWDSICNSTPLIPEAIPCETCITSFSPTPGDYMVSAWVKEDSAPFGTITYTNSSLNISFMGSSSVFNLIPSGQIIDGWQRIEAVITVPTAATGINIELSAASGVAFFDDIRFYPFDGSMMSYVYDPISLRLMAELDERNYATLYEYDEEGKLIRVKKETERGVMTIQENRDNIKKK